MQGNLRVLVLREGIDEAPVIGPGINVQAQRPLVELWKVQHLVHRLSRIHLSRHRSVNIERIGWLKATVPSLIMLLDHAEILHSKPSHRHRHPAVLVLVIVNPRDLANFPADCQQLEQRVLEDQIPGVVVLAEEHIRLQRLFVDRMPLDIVVNALNSEFLFTDGAKPGDELIDVDSFHKCTKMR